MKKLVLAAALALVALFAVAASASAAHNATIRNAGEIRTASSGKVTFRAGEISIACNLTLAGTLASAVSNLERPEERQSLGSISSVSWAECSGGEVAGVLGTPWNILYTGETGAMPNEVRSVSFTVQNAQFRLSVFGGFVNCLYAGEAPVSMAATATRTAGTYTSGLIRTTESSFSKVSGSLCPATGTMTGSFNMSPTQTITVS
jgi:hypothetical protein